MILIFGSYRCSKIEENNSPSASSSSADGTNLFHSRPQRIHSGGLQWPPSLTFVKLLCYVSTQPAWNVWIQAVLFPEASELEGLPDGFPQDEAPGHASGRVDVAAVVHRRAASGNQTALIRSHSSHGEPALLQVLTYSCLARPEAVFSFLDGLGLLVTQLLTSTGPSSAGRRVLVGSLKPVSRMAACRRVLLLGEAPPSPPGSSSSLGRSSSLKSSSFGLDIVFLVLFFTGRAPSLGCRFLFKYGRNPNNRSFCKMQQNPCRTASQGPVVC